MSLVSRRWVLGAGATLAAVPGRLLAAGESDLIGSVAARIGPQGLVSETVEGMTRAAPAGRPLHAGEHWHIGSNSKAMTAALYARLAERGVLRWRAPLPSLFPGMAVHAGWTEVTVEQMMAHVAGLDDRLIAGNWLMERHADRRPVMVQRREFARAMLGAPPSAARGQYVYANANYLVLGAAIEQAVRRSWEEEISRSLFSPLGMTATGFGAPAGDSPWGHRVTPAGLIPVDPAGLADNPPVLGPAGRVQLTMADYGRFLSLFLGGRPDVLQPATIATLIAPPAGTSGYAGGWGLQTSAAGRPSLVHEGSNTFWHAITALYPEDKVGFVVIANQAGGETRAALMRLMGRVQAGARG